jgi:hypothetical protein
MHAPRLLFGVNFNHKFMFKRILLVITLLAVLSIALINFVVLKDKISITIAARDQYRAERNNETAARQKFEKLANDYQAQLDKENLALVTSVAERDDLTLKAADLKQELDKTTKKLDVATDALAAWQTATPPVEDIKAMLTSLKAVTEERDVAVRQNKYLVAANSRLMEGIKTLNGTDRLFEEDDWSLPPGLKGKVIVADPRYQFVVLNIGANQGVLEDGKLLVNRNGKLIGKVKVKSVKSDSSIANVMPGWNLGDVKEGDQVLY